MHTVTLARSNELRLEPFDFGYKFYKENLLANHLTDLWFIADVLRAESVIERADRLVDVALCRR